MSLEFDLEEVNEKMEELAEVEDLTDVLIQEVEQLKQIAEGVRHEKYYEQRGRTRRTFKELMKQMDKVAEGR